MDDDIGVVYLVCKRVSTRTRGSDPCVVLHTTRNIGEAYDLAEMWGDENHHATYFVQTFSLKEEIE